MLAAENGARLAKRTFSSIHELIQSVTVYFNIDVLRTCSGTPTVRWCHGPEKFLGSDGVGPPRRLKSFWRKEALHTRLSLPGCERVFFFLPCHTKVYLGFFLFLLLYNYFGRSIGIAHIGNEEKGRKPSRWQASQQQKIQTRYVFAPPRHHHHHTATEATRRKYRTKN